MLAAVTMNPAPVLAGLGWSWARLELGWVATVSTTMTYEGKILLNSQDNGVADFLRSRHNINI